MNIAVYVNPKLNDFAALQQKLTTLLLNENLNFTFVTEVDSLHFADILLVLGGDGSILKLAKSAVQYNVKILPINAGNVGFLAEFEKDALKEAIQFLKSGLFIEDRRPLLSCSIDKQEYFAVNEFAIHACFMQTEQEIDSHKVLAANIYIDSYKVANIMASGVLVSTPTGSTAFSLSAGGSILTPNVPAFIFTPIAATSLSSRPIVYKDSSTLTVEFTPKSAN